MNILTDELPVTVTIDNTEYEIETDFRACLRIILAFEDNDLTIQEKQDVLLKVIYPIIPRDVQALEKAKWFLNRGEIRDEEANGARVFSFGKDASLIFAAIHQTHKVDLQEIKYLHWWKFLALFMDMGTETTFVDVAGRRKRLKTGRATKDDREIARESPSLYDLPDLDTRTLDEKEAEQDFLRKLEQARNNK